MIVLPESYSRITVSSKMYYVLGIKAKFIMGSEQNS